MAREAEKKKTSKKKKVAEDQSTVTEAPKDEAVTIEPVKSDETVATPLTEPAEPAPEDAADPIEEVNPEPDTSPEETEPEVPAEPLEPQPSIKPPKTDTSSKTKAKLQSLKAKSSKHWPKILGSVVGVVALLTLLVSGVSSQYFRGKTMPNVVVAGVTTSGKTHEQVTAKLDAQVKQLQLKFKAGDKTLQPKFEEIGFQVDTEATVKNALKAKRENGLWARLSFWHHHQVPAVIKTNDTLLNQYLETNLPELTKAPQDSQLQFDASTAAFVITPQADGQGPNVDQLKKQLTALGETLSTQNLSVDVSKEGPAITEAELKPLLEPANQLVQRKVVLTGLGYTYRARPADIASWLTPTPQKDGKIKLIIDTAKVQSYVEGISKRISNTPVDRKILKDETTGAEVVLQEGRDGTELADKTALASAISQALKQNQDTTQVMNIKTAAYQTVNMNAFDKWIEVDLSEQRTTAYERATPVKTFIIASGTRGHETVTGEFAIWLKVRKQTMQGGSKADGSYYSIPNVEWVSYFYKDYALHGAWWRKQFGAPASHGCVNMTNADAQWVYEWAPVGTKVIVHQ